MLKTLNTESVEFKKGWIKDDSGSKAGHDGSEIDRSGMDDNEVRKKGQKTSKSKNLSKFKKMIRSDFLTPEARLAFIELR